MNRLTLSACRATIARVLGTCTTDSRVASYLNEAQERLLPKGRFLGTVVRYRFCTSASCLTLPRQIETIEAWALCNTPLTVRDRWYEFAGNGPGLRRDDLGSAANLIDRGTACTYNDISGTSSKINVVAAVVESATARILLQGYDENAQWIRTQDAGVWIDGEYVAISTATTRSIKTFTNLTGVVKPATNGPVNLFEWPSQLGSNLQQLAYYESDETVPIYRRYLVPDLANQGACDNAQDDCDDKTVTILAKLRHIPVSGDNDFLILQNLSALKTMVQAILKYERNLFADGQAFEKQAVQLLDEELSSYEGDGAVPVVRIDETFGGGLVENEIGLNSVIYR